MKKKSLILGLILVLLLPLQAFAQAAKIIDLKGTVRVMLSQGEWQKAKINMLLNKDSEIETKDDSYCTLAFDEEQKNIMTIKANSRLKIESLQPGSVYLPKGRVFTLIENLARNESFQVRTPTAVAAARGTGWITDFHSNLSTILCFLDTVFAQGLDNAGNPTGGMNVGAGSGLNIGAGGILGELFRLSGLNQEEWDDFIAYLLDLIGEGYFGSEAMAFFEALFNEQHLDYGDLLGEGRRRNEDSGGSRSSGGSSSSNNMKRCE